MPIIRCDAAPPSLKPRCRKCSQNYVDDMFTVSSWIKPVRVPGRYNTVPPYRIKRFKTIKNEFTHFIFIFWFLDISNWFLAIKNHFFRSFRSFSISNDQNLSHFLKNAIFIFCSFFLHLLFFHRYDTVPPYRHPVHRFRRACQSISGPQTNHVCKP